MRDRRVGWDGKRTGAGWGALLRDRRGATALEFALVGPALIALLLAILVTAVTFFTQQSLQTAAEIAARGVITGQTQLADVQGANTGMTKAQLAERFRTNACASLFRYMKCANLMVDVQSASAFGQINTASPTITFDSSGNPNNTWNYNTGGASAVVMVRLMYIWPVPSGPLGLNLSNLRNGKRLLIATSVAKSEAYTT